ncbi:MAG: hypothetical protein AB8H80_22765 [Planctomycetota bacterium]
MGTAGGSGTSLRTTAHGYAEALGLRVVRCADVTAWLDAQMQALTQS